VRVLVLLFFFATPTVACAEDFLIERVRVFDGKRTIDRASVLIKNGKIDAIGPRLRPPKGARVIDGRGHTLLPGLIDAHTQLYGPDRIWSSPLCLA
jgi:imidazolonepropionase-like amidohydrolase